MSGYAGVKNDAVGWKQRQYSQVSLQKKGTIDDLSSPESIKSHERPPLRHIDQYIKAECPCISTRATVALMSCIGFIIMFGMRASMGIVRLHFKNKTSVWGEDVQDTVDSAIFWGYFVTQIPGGLIAAAYPANKLFGAAIGSSAFLNFLVPLIYSYPRILIVIKVMQGLVEGVTYPACHGIMRYWAPPLERSRLATIAFCGCYAGVMFALPISGFLTESIHYKAPFYFYSFAGFIWYIAWLWLVFEKPSYHPSISTKELIFIENSLGSTSDHFAPPNLSNTPWLTFFKSMPCYAIFVANFCRSWNFYLLVLFQAEFFEDSYGTPLEKNGLLGALPHLLMTIVVPSGGMLADKLRKKGTLTTTQVRKLFNCGGFGLEATFFIIMSYCGEVELAVIALSAGVAFSGFAISGYNVNHLDIAPRYASILMGMSNGIGTLAGCVVPFVVALINGEKATKESWRKVFILSACIHYAGIVFYGLFASGELQPWADPSVEEEKHWNQMTESGPLKKSPSTQSNGLLQRRLSGKINYGSVDTPLPPSSGTLPRPPSLEAPSRPAAPYLQSSGANPFRPSALSSGPLTGQPAVPGGNPFRSNITNPFKQEAVQPEAQDTYLHGTVEDRTY